jgi:hypothetical protein
MTPRLPKVNRRFAAPKGDGPPTVNGGGLPTELGSIIGTPGPEQRQVSPSWEGGQSQAELLASVHEKWEMIDYYVLQVVLGREFALFLYGSGGVGKSHRVFRTLDKLGADYVPHSAKLTAPGFRNLLCQHRDAIHVCEDMEGCLRNNADLQGIIRSATWGPKRNGVMRRWISWGTAHGIEPFEFTGALIFCSNSPLAASPELRAMFSRFTNFEMSLSNEEILAVAFDWASRGHVVNGERISPAECQVVVTEMAKCFEGYQARFDLRVLEHTYQDYLSWRAGEAPVPWQRLVSVRVEEWASLMENAANRKYEGGGKRSQSRQRQRQILMEVFGNHDTREDQLRAWMEHGQSRATFYRAARQLGFLSSQNPSQDEK